MSGNWFSKEERNTSHSICSIICHSTGSPHSPRVMRSQSISPCLTASHMPALKLNQSLTKSNHISTLDSCSTPYTPLNQILRTPPYPPQLQHMAIKRTPPRSIPFVSPWSTTEAIKRTPPRSITFVSPWSTTESCGISTPLSKFAAVSLNRRLSTVVPPDAIPLRAPRRLSYSHGYRNFSQPCSGAVDASDLENTNSNAKPLASPVTLRSASFCRSPVEVINERRCRNVLAS